MFLDIARYIVIPVILLIVAILMLADKVRHSN